MKPAVTVIIPAFNSASFLKVAVESVKCQTFQDYEVIVVDDGSTDATYEIARGISAEFPKMRVIKMEHGGLASARNRAIAEMNGTYIALLDSDDCWQPDKLEKCIDFLKRNDAMSIVYHPLSSIRHDGRPMREHRRRPRFGQLTEAIFHHSFIHDSAVVFHKRVIEKCGLFNQALPVGVGHEYWLRVSKDFQLGLLNEKLGLRRCHERALDRLDQARTARIRCEILERFYFQQEGRLLLPRTRKALARMASLRCKAARLELQVKNYQKASEYLVQAIKFCPEFLKSYPFFVHCKVMMLINRIKLPFKS